MTEIGRRSNSLDKLNDDTERYTKGDMWDRDLQSAKESLLCKISQWLQMTKVVKTCTGWAGYGDCFTLHRHREVPGRCLVLYTSEYTINRIFCDMGFTITIPLCRCE